MAPKLSQIVVVVLLLIYLILTGYTIYMISDQIQGKDRHSLFSIIATMVLGVAMCIYRLLRGMRTRTVKYIHMVLQTVAILIFACAMLLDRPKAEGGPAYMHKWPCYLGLSALGFQYCMGLFVFTYLYENRRVRFVMAPIHDIVGMWTFIILVACLVVGNHTCVGEAAQNPNMCLFNLQVFFILWVIAVFIIYFIVLCPLFEWELVGMM